MAVHIVQSYLVAVAGLVVGAVMGLVAAALLRNRIAARGSVRRWDAWVTLPLLLAAAGRALTLIPQVEMLRQVLFGLYAASLIGTVIFALGGLAIWRLGALLFPAGSIAAYFDFALSGHQADYVGLLVKVVELAAIIAALVPVFMRERAYGERQMAA